MCIVVQVRLGEGKGVYERAVRALKAWEMHKGSSDTGIYRHGGVVATMVRAALLICLCVCMYVRACVYIKA